MSDQAEQVAVDENELYAEVFEEEAREAEAEDSWWPLAKKGLIVLGLILGAIWFLNSDTFVASEAREQWVIQCRGHSPSDVCEETSDEHHQFCYYHEGLGQGWIHYFDRFLALLTGNRKKQFLYKHTPEYDEFAYHACLDERLRVAKLTED